MSSRPGNRGRVRARRCAVQALYQWQLTDQEAGEIIIQFLDAQDFSAVDEDLFRRLVRGVIEEHQALGEKLQPHLDRDFAQCDVMERIILLMGAWQLTHDPALPPTVLIDESIELAHTFGSPQSHAYVNGVLDKAARDWPVSLLGQ